MSNLYKVDKQTTNFGVGGEQWGTCRGSANYASMHLQILYIAKHLNVLFFKKKKNPTTTHFCYREPRWKSFCAKMVSVLTVSSGISIRIQAWPSYFAIWDRNFYNCLSLGVKIQRQQNNSQFADFSWHAELAVDVATSFCPVVELVALSGSFSDTCISSCLKNQNDCQTHFPAGTSGSF